MLITRKFLRSFFVLSTIFLAIACSAIFLLMRYEFRSSLRDSLKAEAENVAVMAGHEYGMGDLVTLRSSLNWLAVGRTWSNAEFKDSAGTTIWTYEKKEAGKVFDEIQTKTPPSQSKASKSEVDPLQVGVPVQDANSSTTMGTFSVTKDAHDDSARFYDEALAVMAGIILFWASFFCIIWFLAERSFAPLKTMLASIKSRASDLALPLDPAAGNDEAKLMSSWFESLANAWQEASRTAVANERLAAIARTTQALAHDVRKPFSILNIGLSMLNRVKDEPEKVSSVLNKLVPEINKAISSVDGMIADVLEIGSTSTQLIQEPAAPEALIEAVIEEIFRVYPKADISMSYDLAHKSMVNVHVQKVARVFSNIFGNAVQALNHNGKVWFATKESNGFVEFTIGNAGSFIPPESLARLFEAFFTSGKKGGTGLGLAIAEKVVGAHGGKLWCASAKSAQYPQGFVEFHFTLPVALTQVSSYGGKLPGHSSKVTKAVLALGDSTPGMQDGKTEEELRLESQVVAASKALGRKLQVLVVDDELIYRAGLIGVLTHSLELAATVLVKEAATSGEAISSCRDFTPDLVITDVDLGVNSEIDGFDLVQVLRADLAANGRNESVISILSNRIVPADGKTAIAKGADAFISKPISRTQLLKLLLQTFKSLESAVALQDFAEFRTPARPGVAVVEDNLFMLEAWGDALAADAEVFSFASPEDLIGQIEKEPGFLDRLSFVVTDFHFDNSTKYDGLDVGKLVKSRRPSLSVLLSSDGETKGLDLVGSVDHVIAKSPSSFAGLAQQYSI